MSTMRGHRYPRFEARSLFRGPTWWQLGAVAVVLLLAFGALRHGALLLSGGGAAGGSGAARVADG